MNNQYEYEGAYNEYPIQEGTALFSDGSMLKTHDIFNPLPKFMYEADILFVDSPWNKSNYATFYTKADIIPVFDYDKFIIRLFECIRLINPVTCYLEIGKEYLQEYMQNLKKIYPYVTVYNSTYYHNKNNICYVIRGSRKHKKPSLDNIDEADIIKEICKYESFECIGDLCMGQGLLALAAFESNHKFVGTELNHKRLSVTLKRLTAKGAKYKIQKENKNIIKENREKANLTQSEVAHCIGIKLRAYQGYENGERDISKISFSSGMRLAKILNISPEEFLNNL